MLYRLLILAEGGSGELNPTKVLIRDGDLQDIIDDVKEHAEDGNETGVGLLGRIQHNKVYVITRIVKSGPRSERSSIRYTTDEEKILQELREEKSKNEDARYLGDLHSHPWPTTPMPSGIDIDQLKRARKVRSWFIIAVTSSTGEVKFFGLDKNGNRQDIPYQVIPEEFKEENLLARISEITDSETLRKVRVGILGCGSLSSAVVTGLAGTGIRDYVLCDMDELAVVNVIRHIGGIQQIGQPKTVILAEHIQSHNPLASVLTVEDDLIKNRKLLHAIIESCDIIVAASGNPELNYHINSICVELNKPVVYGGIYAGAKSAYIFCVPSKKHACFDCIFQLTSAAIDQNTLKRKYGLADGEMKEAQGMFSDISIPGHIITKMTLWLLLGTEMKFNLVRYYDDPRIERLYISKRELCATCDYENWLKEEERRFEKNESKTGKIVRKIKNKFRSKKK